MTNVLIVDDSRVASSYMQSVVNDSPGYDLVGVLSSTDMADIACRRNADDGKALCTGKSCDCTAGSAELTVVRRCSAYSVIH